MLQTDASISHGSSGGPLLDDKGNVVGVTTSGLKVGQNLNFVVPASYIKKLLNNANKPQKIAAVVSRIFAGTKTGQVWE